MVVRGFRRFFYPKVFLLVLRTSVDFWAVLALLFQTFLTGDCVL